MSTSPATPSAASRAAPAAFSLSQNYPNPFSAAMEIRFDLPTASAVTLVVYDLLGREVARLVEERREAGVHRVRFDGSTLPSGVYLYRFRASDFAQTRRMLLVE